MKCPSCNKFAALEMQEPEVNELSFDSESRMVTADVRILRNSECCGDEMKEYTFNVEEEVGQEIADKMDAILKDDPEAEFDVEEGSVEILEEGGGRYRKSYFGFTLSANITVAKATTPRTAEQQAELEALDAKLAAINKANNERRDFSAPRVNEPEADRARRIELDGIGRPVNEELGSVDLTDKCAASEMDELN